ncbi:MAG: glycoside hydrolase, partial [Ruminococcus sp.]|nr:glycoside hydrolase [Ruminococcus sp.]
HLDVSYPSAQVYKTALEKFLSTGLEVQITELDITCGSDSAQAALFKDIFELAVKHADQIPALTVWGTHDSISWRSSQNPLLFGAGYTPKSAYTSVMSINVPSGTPVVTTPAPVVTTPAPSTTVSTQPTSGSNTVKGDIDGNGSVTSSDLVKLMQAIVGKASLTSQQKNNADMNGDGKITIIDLIKFKNILI